LPQPASPSVPSCESALTAKRQSALALFLVISFCAVGPSRTLGRPEAPALLRVDPQTMEGRLIYRAEPVYPSLAKQRQIQGPVRLEALISTKGTIRRLRLISGHPLLAPAALQAVRKWRYRPLMMNGRPAEVFTEIKVEFPPRKPPGSQPPNQI